MREEQNPIRSTWLFAGILLLAGIANLLSRNGVPAFEAAMTVLNYLSDQYTNIFRLYQSSQSRDSCRRDNF